MAFWENDIFRVARWGEWRQLLQATGNPSGDSYYPAPSCPAVLAGVCWHGSLEWLLKIQVLPFPMYRYQILTLYTFNSDNFFLSIYLNKAEKNNLAPWCVTPKSNLGLGSPDDSGSQQSAHRGRCHGPARWQTQRPGKAGCFLRPVRWSMQRKAAPSPSGVQWPSCHQWADTAEKPRKTPSPFLTFWGAERVDRETRNSPAVLPSDGRKKGAGLTWCDRYNLIF